MDNIKMECEMCHKQYNNRFDLHSQLNNSEKRYRMICCTCLGHKQLSCTEKSNMQSVEEQVKKMSMKQLMKEIQDELDIYWAEELGDSRFRVLFNELIKRVKDYRMMD